MSLFRLFLAAAFWMVITATSEVKAESALTKSDVALTLFPESNSEIVQSLPKGTAVEVLQETNGWTLVQFSTKGKTAKGWVNSNQLLRADDAPAGKTTMGRTYANPAFKPVAEPQFNYRDDGFRFSIAVNPVLLLFPSLDLQLGFQFHPHFRLNIEPIVWAWAWDDDGLDGALYGGALTGTFFIDPWQGWYVEPGFLGLRGSSSGWITGGQVIGGYEHHWASGLFTNMGLGAGVAYFNDDSDDSFWDFDGVYPIVTFNLFLGYQF